MTTNRVLAADLPAINRPSITNKAFIVCVFAGLFYCYVYYLRVAPSVISFELMQTFNISNTGLGLLSASYYYAYLLAQIPVGLLIDKYGPRVVLTLACVICGLGTYCFTLSNQILVAQMGRLIIGFGSAFAFVGFLKIISSWLPRHYYALMVGICTSAGMLGAIGGEIIFAKQLQYQPWQSALNVSAIVGLTLAILMWLIIRDNPHSNMTNEVKHSSEPMLQSFVLKLRSKPIWLAGLIGCFSFLPLSGFAEMWAMPFLEVIGYSKTQAAFASSMVFLGFGIGGPLWGIVSNRLASRRLPLIFGSIVAGFSASVIIFMPYIPSFYMYTALFCLGFFSSAEILVFSIGEDITSKHTSATTSALINMIVIIGSIIAQPMIGMILDIISSTSVSQYQTALLVIPTLLFTAGVLSFILPETYKNN